MLLCQGVFSYASSCTVYTLPMSVHWVDESVVDSFECSHIICLRLNLYAIQCMVTCTEEFCMLEYLSVQGGRVPITRVQWQKTFVDQSVKRMKHLPPPRNTIWILLKVSTVVKVLRRHPVAVSMNKPQSFLSVSFIFVFTNTNENHETIQVSAEIDKCMFDNNKKCSKVDPKMR